MAKETKHEKFLRLSEARVNKIAKMYQLIGNMTDKRNYAYTDEEVEDMLNFLQQMLDELRDKFKSNGELKIFKHKN